MGPSAAVCAAWPRSLSSSIDCSTTPREARRMLRGLGLALALLLIVPPAEAKTRKGFLTVTGGGGGLVGSVGGEVLRSRFLPRFDLGLGYQVSSSFTLEATYGWSGTWEPQGPVTPLPLFERPPADTQRAYWVGTNPLLLRCKWAWGGARTEYLKPELSLAAGWMQVTRLLRNPAFVAPQETSQMLATVELGGGALLVSSR